MAGVPVDDVMVFDAPSGRRPPMSSGFAAAGVGGIATAEQLLAAGAIGPCEFVRGELVMMSPAGFEHGAVTLGNDAVMLTSIVVPGLGAVLADIFPPIDRR